MKIESLESTVASLESELSQGSGRENSAEKMLNSRVNTPDATRGSGDGSSLSGNSPRFGRNSLEVIELQALAKVSEVECARLTELVQVLEKNLSTANARNCNVELNLRQERSKCATLQTLLEKAHLDLRQLSRDKIKPSSNYGSKRSLDDDSVTPENVNALRNQVKGLEQQLAVQKGDIKELSEQREKDLKIYMNMNADSRRIFSQALAKVGVSAEM